MKFGIPALRLRRFLIPAVLLSSASMPAGAQITGSNDYALGGSSVMWYPFASALYRNPAELGRIHQAEFFLGTSRVSNLSSMTGVFFEPFVGTFAAGIANLGSVKQFSAGYGRIFLLQHAVGASLNYKPEAPDKFSFGLGVSTHFADSSNQNSGLHAGLAVTNVGPNVQPGQVGLSAGAAYWLKPDMIRVQAALLQEDKGLILLGAEASPASWLCLQLGIRTFKRISAGLSIPLPYFLAQFGIAREGFSLSFNFRISDPAVDQRTKFHELGLKAYGEQRYYDAHQSFRTALQYDETFAQSRVFADQSWADLQSNSFKLLQEAKTFEDGGKDTEASKRYALVLKMDSNNVDAQSRSGSVQARIQARVKQLISTGDSLFDRKNYESAQRVYEQALEMDPENETISPRLEDLAVLLKQTTQLSLSRAKSYLDRNQLDEAQREYERLLQNDPRNPQARSGLETIKSRRVNEILERGKTAFNQSRYFEALNIFTEVLQRDDKNREAKTLFERAREALLPEVEKYFKAGLQFYVKENYKAALESWGKALTIQPQHQATQEYYKRAEEKQKAIEKLEKEN